jgi:protein-tyrosine phosphatase
MIDIHSHILPGIDDGSPSLEISLDMLRMAADNGTTDIVATPHNNMTFPYDGEVIDGLFRRLSDSAAGMIKIHLGCDFHLSVDNVHDALANPAKYTINGKGYLMVELPDLTSLSAMRSVLNRMLETRITPIITHPERNPSVQSHLKDVESWVRDGCLMQVTAQSLTGRFGSRAKSFAESLFQADLVHFVASDAHDCEDRVPILTPAYKIVSQRWGVEKADSLFIYNPAAALIGEPIYAVPNPKKSFLFSLLHPR